MDQRWANGISQLNQRRASVAAAGGFVRIEKQHASGMFPQLAPDFIKARDNTGVHDISVDWIRSGG